MTLTTEPTTRTLPVADMASVAAHTRGLLREHRGHDDEGAWACTRSRRPPRSPRRGWSATSSTR